MEAAPVGLILAALAGASIPAGAALAVIEARLSGSLHDRITHTVGAFGGGALLAAIAFVLLPEATTALAPVPLLLWFVLGGIVFHALDRLLAAHGGGVAQFLAMMLDYVPEAMALGALVAGRPDVALLTAALIALQNVPEGFTAWRGLIGSGHASQRRLVLLFVLMVPVGPIAAWIGLTWLGAMPAVLGAVMAFASGGILYLVFEDVAPAAHLKGTGLPALGALGGFGLGLAGHLAVGGAG